MTENAAGSSLKTGSPWIAAGEVHVSEGKNVAGPQPGVVSKLEGYHKMTLDGRDEGTTMALKAAPHLEARANGRIIAVIGDSSRIGESGLSIVAAARAGVIGLVKSLAREFGKSGTTANGISLGLVETAHDPAWVEANRERLTKLYPLRRLGKPADVAPTVALLASDHAAWITGQVISISGGYSMV